jgi:hypothetical protein
VAASLSTLTFCSSFSESSSTCSSSIAVELRSWVMTSPSWIGSVDAPSGGTSATNRSPNRVRGSSRAWTLRGMNVIRSGSSANRSEAVWPSLSIDRTCPTTTSRSFTSAFWLSCSPTRSVRSVTQVTASKALL